MSNFTYQNHPVIQILSLTRIIHTSNNLLRSLNAISSKLKSKQYRQIITKAIRSKQSENTKSSFVDDFIKSVDLFRSLKFQRITEDELDKIYTQLVNGTKISEIDKKFTFAFPFFVDNLQTITMDSLKQMQNLFQRIRKFDDEQSHSLFSVNFGSNNSTNTNRQNTPKTHFQFIIDLNNSDVISMIDFYIMFILFSVISWIVNAETIENLDGLNLIFDKLNLLLTLFSDIENLNMTKTTSTSFFAINYLRAREVAINSSLFLLDYVEHNFANFTFSSELFEILNTFFQKANLIESQKTLIKGNVNSAHSLTNSSQEVIDFENNFYTTAFHLLFDSLQIEIRKSRNEIQTFCNFISQVLDDFNDKMIFDNDTFLYMYGILSPKLATLDDVILPFFIRICHHYSTKNDKVCSNFVGFLSNFLKENNRNPIELASTEEMNDITNIYIKQIDNVTSIGYRSTVQNFQFNFIDQPTFEQGFNLAQPLQKPPSLREYFSNEILSKIDLISELDVGVEFSKQISIILNQISYDPACFCFNFACFLLLCEDQSNISIDLLTTIFNSPIFNGQYIDVESSSRPIIHSILFYSISLLIHSKSLFSFFDLLITTKMYIPRILGTIFGYLTILINQISMIKYSNQKNPKISALHETISEYFQSKKFILLFYNISLFYQTANLNDVQNKTEIEWCRQQLLTFMQPFIESWSDSRIFNSMFLSYLFEQPLQKFVFQHLKKLWINENSDTTIIYSIFETCQLLLNESQDNKPKVIYLIDHVLKIINSILSELNSTLKATFFPLHKPLINIMQQLDKEDMDLICEILEYFSITADQMNIDQNTITTFSETIKKIEVTHDIRMKLIRLLAGSQSTSILSHFFIKQPFALPLFITLFVDKQHQDQLNVNFKLIENLITFSNKNAIMCHKGKLDLILLSFIEIAFSIINKTEFDIESNSKLLIDFNSIHQSLLEKDVDELKLEINNSISLFLKIALVASSIDVVHKYISLLSNSFRLNDKTKSDFYLNNLIDLITMKFRMPANILPLTVRRTPTIELHGINAEHFQDGFTATFWVYLNQQSLKCHSVLFTMADSSHHIITCKIVDTTIEVRVFTKNLSFSLTSNYNFPLEQWFLLSITFNKKDKMYEVTGTVNSTLLHLNQIEYFEFKDFVRIVVNNNSNYVDPVLDIDKLYSKNYSFKRCCSYNNLEPKFTLKTFVDSNQKNHVDFIENFTGQDVKIDNELGFEFEEVEGAFLGPFGFFTPLQLPKIIQMHNQGPRTQYLNKILYVQFEKMNGLFTVIPDGVHFDFNLLGPRYIQSISFDEVLIQYFKIHSLIPLFKFEEEKSDKIVGLFSTLLSLAEYAQNSFYQFHGFTMISHLLKSYKSLSYSLYSKFVNLNENLTVNQLKQDLLKTIVLRFDLWCKSNLETQQRIIKHWIHTYFTQPSDFEDIMYILNVYNNNSSIQNNLLNLLFTSNDKLNLVENTIKFISFVINQSETYHNDIIYLIGFIRDNAQHFSSSIHFINLIPLVCKLNSESFFVFIEMFNNLYKYQKIKEPKHLGGLFLVLVNLIDILKLNNIDFINQLIEKTNEIPECIVILFYILAFSNPNQNVIDIVMVNLKANSQFCFSKNWFLYPVISAIMINNKHYTEFIMNFIVQSNIEKTGWKSIYSLILIICESVNYSNFIVNSYDIIKLFLTALLNLEKIDDEILLLSHFYLFFKPNSYKNLALTELFKHSPYCSIKPNQNRSNHEIEKPTKTVLFENIKKNMKKERIYKLSFRFNKEGSWVDQDFATKLVELSRNNPKFENMTKALRILIKHSNPDGNINDVFESINLSPFITQMNNLYLINSKFVIKDIKIPKNDDLIYLAKCQQEIHERKMDAENDYAYHCWNTQWQALTSESAPWHNFQYTENEKSHLKIDFTPCYAYCPMKIEKDSHYPTHHSFRENQIIVARNMYRNQLNQVQNATKNKPIGRRNSTFLQNFKILNNDPEINPNLLKELPEFTLQVEMITIKRRDKGLCFFNKDKIELMLTKPLNKHHENHTTVNSNSIKIIDIFYQDIKLIFGRRILHHPTAIEIFTNIKGSYLLNFPTSTTNDVVDKLISISSNKSLKVILTPSHLINEPPEISSPITTGFSILSKATATVTSPLLSRIQGTPTETVPNDNSSFYHYLNSLTNVWRYKIISNFEYLILLNMLSGRSFNDPSMYPVFPWIVADYESDTIRLNDKEFFRDLSLPVGALNKSRLKDLILRRKEMIEINDEYIFLYGAGYSTPISLFNWMIRLEPFASLHVEMQNGHFDHPQRLFYSLKTAFKLATSNSNDYRELIPEFYFLPDFLVNKNGFNFGGLKEGVIPFDVIRQNVAEGKEMNLSDSNTNLDLINSIYDEFNNESIDSSNNELLQQSLNDEINHESTNENEIETIDHSKEFNDITPEKEKRTTDHSTDFNETENNGSMNEKETTNNLIEKEKDEINDDSGNPPSMNEKENNEKDATSDLIEKERNEKVNDETINNIQLIESSGENSMDEFNSLKQIPQNNSNEAIQSNKSDDSYSSYWEEEEEEEEHYEKVDSPPVKKPDVNQRINDVELPAWANNSIDFIYKHRKLLESKFVSKHLHKWIDLIFGVDQNNSNNNQFHPWMYSNVWDKLKTKKTHKGDNQADVKQIEEFLMQCGQIPLQLFSQRHPVRHSFKKQIFLTENLVIHFSKSAKSKIKHSFSIDTKTEKPSFQGIKLTPEKESRRMSIGAQRVSSSLLFNTKPANQFMTVVYSEIIAKMDNSLIFVYITSRGNIIRSTVSLDNIDMHYFGSDESIEDDVLKKYTVFRGSLVISNAEGSIKSYDLLMENSKLHLEKEVKSNIGQLNYLISDHNLLVSCGSDSTANIYDQNINLVHSIQSFNGQIVSAYVNSTFSIVALINRNSSVLLISTTNGTLSKMLTFGNREPLKVIVSKSWGFVLVYLKEIFYEKNQERCKFNYYLALFTVNGEKIGEKKLPCVETILTWETFTSPDSFDYLAFADQKGNLFVTEIYPFIIGSNFMNKNKKASEETLKPVFESETEIKTIYYWEDRRILAGICEDGSAFMIPLDYHIFKYV